MHGGEGQTIDRVGAQKVACHRHGPAPWQPLSLMERQNLALAGAPRVTDASIVAESEVD